MKIKLVIFLALLTVILSGCGKKGALVRPETLVPAAVADLRVTQKGEHFLVTWSRPSKEEGGKPLRDLAGFRLFKRDVLPPGEDCEECPTAYRLALAVDLEYPKGVMILGSQYIFFDEDTVIGKAYRYKIYSNNKEGAESRISNRAGKKKLPLPAPPELKASSSPISIELKWNANEASLKGSIIGYNIYRKKDGEAFLVFPFNPVPIRENVFEDTRVEPGVRYSYVIRTIVESDGETAESGPSNEVQGALTEP